MINIKIFKSINCQKPEFNSYDKFVNKDLFYF